jgi:hypothetical protein
VVGALVVRRTTGEHADAIKAGDRDPRRMHPHLHMQLARTIIDGRLRDAQARHRNGHMRQLGNRWPRRLPTR